MVFVKKRFIGIGLAVTFGIYAFYDMAREWRGGSEELYRLHFLCRHLFGVFGRVGVEF